MMLLDPYDRDVVCPIVACNESAARMNGYSRAELIGKPISLLTRDPDTYEELATYIDRLHEEGLISEDDIHYRKNGTEFPLEFRLSWSTLEVENSYWGSTETSHSERCSRKPWHAKQCTTI